MEVKNMEEELTKETAKRIMGIKGEARGIALKADMENVIREKGEEGLKKLEGELESLGYPIKYKEINIGAFYPIGLDIINMLAIKKLFNFDEEKLKKMGAIVPKFSLFVKLFLKYFYSLKKMAEEAQALWGKHYTVGNLKVMEINEEKKYIVLRLENFNLHPVYCPFLEGYFSQICRLIIGKEVFSEEVKCFFRGDEYHEYLLKWR